MAKRSTNLRPRTTNRRGTNGPKKRSKPTAEVQASSLKYRSLDDDWQPHRTDFVGVATSNLEARVPVVCGRIRRDFRELAGIVKELRDRKEYKSWEQYLKDRKWPFSKRQADRLISALETADFVEGPLLADYLDDRYLDDAGLPKQLPAPAPVPNEFVARALQEYPEADRQIIWRHASDLARIDDEGPQEPNVNDVRDGAKILQQDREADQEFEVLEKESDLEAIRSSILAGGGSLPEGEEEDNAAKKSGSSPPPVYRIVVSKTNIDDRSRIADIFSGLMVRKFNGNALTGFASMAVAELTKNDAADRLRKLADLLPQLKGSMDIKLEGVRQ